MGKASRTIGIAASLAFGIVLVYYCCDLSWRRRKRKLTASKSKHHDQIRQSYDRPLDGWEALVTERHQQVGSDVDVYLLLLKCRGNLLEEQATRIALQKLCSKHPVLNRQIILTRSDANDRFAFTHDTETPDVELARIHSDDWKTVIQQELARKFQPNCRLWRLSVLDQGVNGEEGIYPLVFTFHRTVVDKHSFTAIVCDEFLQFLAKESVRGDTGFPDPVKPAPSRDRLLIDPPEVSIGLMDSMSEMFGYGNSLQDTVATHDQNSPDALTEAVCFHFQQTNPKTGTDVITLSMGANKTSAIRDLCRNLRLDFRDFAMAAVVMSLSDIVKDANILNGVLEEVALGFGVDLRAYVGAARTSVGNLSNDLKVEIDLVGGADDIWEVARKCHKRLDAILDPVSVTREINRLLTSSSEVRMRGNSNCTPLVTMSIHDDSTTKIDENSNSSNETRNSSSLKNHSQTGHQKSGSSNKSRMQSYTCEGLFTLSNDASPNTSPIAISLVVQNQKMFWSLQYQQHRIPKIAVHRLGKLLQFYVKKCSSVTSSSIISG